jgi:LuxR family maltose regulon positive regulatory protein
VAAAAEVAQAHDLPRSQARVYLAQGNPAAALAVLDSWRRQMEARGWADEQLKTLMLQALAHQAKGNPDAALHFLGEALALAAPGGFVRLFVDEGPAMAQLLSAAAAQGVMPDDTGRLLAAFARRTVDGRRWTNDKVVDLIWGGHPPGSATPSLPEPLSPREMEILHLLAQGLSNAEIGERLCIALNMVKGHNRRIFGKLGVQRRTEAIARARVLGLLASDL